MPKKPTKKPRAKPKKPAATARGAERAAKRTAKKPALDDDPGPFTGFPKRGVAFLAALERMNDKAFFDAHRADYDEGLLAPGRAFVAAFGAGLRARISSSIQGVPRVGGSIFRIHRDTRFSKDKSPYKTHFDMWFWDGPHDGKGWERSGFFVRLTGRGLMIGVGVHDFEPPMLTRYRAAVDDEKRGNALVRAIADIEKTGAVLGGSALVRVPPPYGAEHPRGALLRHKGLHAGVDGPHPKELVDERLVDVALDRAERLAPLHAWIMKHLVA